MSTLAGSAIEALDRAGKEAATYLSLRRNVRRETVSYEEADFSERVFMLVDDMALSLDGQHYWINEPDSGWRVYTARTIEEEDAGVLLFLLSAVAP